eukprot:XP_011660488.1 PREDICTED: uncharacterized protein LOC100893381 isoform X2 [Strongylocentrotus purpuratus]
MATAEAFEPFTCGEKRKEVVVSFITSDSEDDASVQTKRNIWRTASMLSPCEKVLSFLDCEEKTEFMRVKPLEISTKLEPEKKYLCLKYGPKKKPMFIHLDFTDESRENFDEWYDFLRRMMGLESPQRRSTENARTLQKPKSPPKQRIMSSFQLSIPVILETANSSKSPGTPDDVFKPPFSDTASGSESPESLDSDSASDISSFHSLISICSVNDIYNYPKDLLSQHQFKIYKDEIVVTQSVPDSKLHPGDTIALRTGEGTTGEGTTFKDAEQFREYIKKTVAPTIMLAVTPGVGITMKDGDQKLTIDITGQKRPDAVEAALKACNQSRLAIAEINGAPIPVGTHEHQVAQILGEALRGDSTECHLHLIPRSLMRAESDDQETRPINVEDSSSVSGNTTTTDHEETEC